MKLIRYIHTAFFFVLSSLGVASASGTHADIRVEPHAYSGMRGDEPSKQMTIHTKVDWKNKSNVTPAAILFHGDFETLGRKDNSVDVDRAWIQAPIKNGCVVFGRIHPFDVSRNPEGKRPWGYVAQSHAQNRSILLGSPFSETVFSSPVQQGWVGAHAWSDASFSKPFQFGFSASPVFIPSQGSEVSYSAPANARTARFARQPPSDAEIEGHQYPIEYHLDDSEIMSEVLQPQYMGQTYSRLENRSVTWETWTSLRRAPSIEPELETTGKLDVRENNPKVIATVKPHFVQKWVTSFNQRLSRRAAKENALFSSFEYEQGGRFGGEVGAESKYLTVSYLTENGTPLYADHLVQFEGRVPTSVGTFYGGSKYHLYQNAYWLKGGVRTRASDDIDLDFGMDVFAGDRNTYFGDWRTNDRVYFGINWRLGS